MNLSRSTFLKGLLLAAGGTGLGGCTCPFSSGKAKIAVQLYSICQYIAGKDGKPGAGLERTLQQLAEIGFKGVEFAGYYGHTPDQLRQMLANAGLAACGTHVSRDAFSPEKIKATCEFNRAYGNTLIICPGGGNFPPGSTWGKVAWSDKVPDFLKMLVDYYAKAADTAATFGCQIGLHNHAWEFQLKSPEGQTYWDYFFSNTPQNVIMEQDVGWTTNAGEDPCEQFRKYPHRSITLHAKENGMGAKDFEGILGQPGTGPKGVDWNRVKKAADADGVKWWVIECERNFDSLKAVAASHQFLKTLGLN